MRRYCLTIEPRALESCSPPEGKARRYRVSSSARIQRIGSRGPGKVDPDGPTVFAQLFEQSLDRPEQLGGRQVAECPQRFGHLLGGARGQPAAAEAAFDPSQRLGIEQPCPLRC